MKENIDHTIPLSTPPRPLDGKTVYLSMSHIAGVEMVHEAYSSAKLREAGGPGDLTDEYFGETPYVCVRG